MNKEKFEQLVLEVLPIADQLCEVAKTNEIKNLLSLTVGEDGYIAFQVNGKKIYSSYRPQYGSKVIIDDWCQDGDINV